MATAFGLKVIQSKYSANTGSKGSIYFISASDATALFVGDPVKTTATNVSTTGDHPTITRASSGDTIRGVMIGFVPDPLTTLTTYRPASTQALIIVDDDPNALFIAAEDGIGGVLATTSMSKTVDLISGTGNTVTGRSGFLVDSSTAGTSTATFLIQGIDHTIGNALTANTIDGTATVIRLTANKHELKSTAGV